MDNYFDHVLVRTNNKRTDNIKTYIIGPPPAEIISIGYLVCNDQSLDGGSCLVVLASGWELPPAIRFPAEDS